MTAPRRIDHLQEWASVIIVFALALYLVIGIVAWTWMLLNDIEVPGAFATVLAAVIGAFAGVLTPLRMPSRGHSDADKAPSAGESIPQPPTQPPPSPGGREPDIGR